MNEATKEPAALPDALVEAMLLDTAAATPPDGLRARVKERALWRIASARAAAPAEVIEVLRNDGWKPFLPNAEMKVLYDDGTTLSWLVRLGPGGSLPPHDHQHGVEECLMLEGELEVNGVLYHAGDYSVALQGSRHDVVRSATGATFFLRSPSPRAHREGAV